MGYLRKAAPAYLPVNLFNALVGALYYIVQILFYRMLIDLILYDSPSLFAAAMYFLGYQVFCLAYRFFQIHLIINPVFPAVYHTVFQR